jgi:hypothetical protein
MGLESRPAVGAFGATAHAATETVTVTGVTRAVTHSLAACGLKQAARSAREAAREGGVREAQGMSDVRSRP